MTSPSPGSSATDARPLAVVNTLVLSRFVGPPSAGALTTGMRAMRARTKLLIAAALALTISHGTSAAQGDVVPTIDVGHETTSSGMPPAPSAVSPAADTLTGDWGGGRTWLRDQGITLAPRFTQFLQGMPAGDGKHGLDYGAKLDLLGNANLSKLGFWDGLSMTVHGEVQFWT